ncbi:MAG: molybdate ABC transporter permease subunit [Acidimicrobiales bacterium]|nr:molybdate ABC transporter permease subunit [Acidimicrobiales bacterium]
MTPSTAAPRPVAVAAGLGTLLLAIPLLALLLDVPWIELPRLLTSTESLDALRVSGVVSLVAALLSVLLGVPLAYILARTDFPGRGIIRAIVTVPLILPPVVTGVALLSGFGRRGWMGDVFGFGLPLTTVGAILAATIVSMPFLILSVEGAFRSGDGRLEKMAHSLGAGPLETFWRVSVPVVRPSIVAGAVLAWARALGEFGATITFAGSVQGVTRTLPLEVVLAYEQDPERALALSVLLLAVSLSVLFALRDRFLPSR